MYFNNFKQFLAAQGSSRSLVVYCFVGRLVCPPMYVKKGPLECQMVTKTYLPSNLCDNSDSSDSINSSDSSDSSNISESSDSSESSKSSQRSDSSDGEQFFPTIIFFCIFLTT